MEMITRISSPLSESWVAWVVLLLVLLWTLNSMFLPEISIVFRGLFSRGERTYSSSGGQIQLTTWLFRVGLSALVVQILLDNGDVFLLLDYGVIVGIISVAFLVQWLLIRLVGGVFVSYRLLESALDQRTIVMNAFCGLLPVVFLLSRFEKVSEIVLVLLLVLYVGIVVVKFVQLFYRNLLSILYMLLYIISLEVVPLVGAILWIKNIL